MMLMTGNIVCSSLSCKGLLNVVFDGSMNFERGVGVIDLSL